MDEQRLVDADALIDGMKKRCNSLIKEYGSLDHYADGFAEAINYAENAPTVDAVSRGVHDQVRWERDVAIEQLEEHGIPFGGIAPDVVKVVRCKDCKHYNVFRLECHNGHMNGIIGIDGFCSYGERKDNA